MALTFEWDPRKNTENLKKHRVGFDEALTAFADPLGRIREDPRHSDGELRLSLLGVSVRQRLLVIMFVERDEDRIRLISARRATRREQHDYEESST